MRLDPAVKQQIERAIKAVESESTLRDRDTVLRVLQRACKQAERALKNELGQSGAVESPDDFALSLVRSALSHAVAPPAHTSALELWGGSAQYEDSDVRWVSALIHYL